MLAKTSGQSTPLSSSTIVSTPTSPQFSKVDIFQDDLFPNSRLPSSVLVEYITLKLSRSSPIYVYDEAQQVGFGTITKQWASAASQSSRVVSLQTRAGAGLSLVGGFSQKIPREQDTSVAAFTSPAGLAAMAPSFVHLPQPSSGRKLVLQVPAVTSIGERLVLSPTLSRLSAIWNVLPSNITVLLSSTPQEAVDFASVAFQIKNSHVIHLFNHFTSTREIGHSTSLSRTMVENSLDIRDAIANAGYSFFEYHGSPDATNIIVLLNGALALAVKNAIHESDQLIGVVIVKVYRPWDPQALRSIIPNSATIIRVVEDVPSPNAQGTLYGDVFSALWDGISKRHYYSHGIEPVQLQQLLTGPNNIVSYLEEMTGIKLRPSTTTAPKSVLLFSLPASPLSSVPAFVHELFLTKTDILARRLDDHDAFSKPGGITASRLIISRPTDTPNIPIPSILPITSESSGYSDLLVILDHSLLKTHSLLQHAKASSTVLVTTSWAPSEFLANLPSPTANLIIGRGLRISVIDVKSIASAIVGAAGPLHDAVQNLLVELAFLRLYLGPVATEDSVLQLAEAFFGDTVEGIPLAKYNAHAWSGLFLVEHSKALEEDNVSFLKTFESNDVLVGPAKDPVDDGARLGTWHDAAKHLLFPSVFLQPQETPEADSLSQLSLRPEAPETTFLVTCTVNKRLTPLEYDRNVFHLEFDTSGTGLKYAIGEALGVHGWNDEEEVLDFCNWYGVDPKRLITLPLPSDDKKSHTRTVFQVLQQQIDLFGKPPKSFYTDLADYASSDVDRYALRFIGSPEGSATFKKLSEKDNITFAEVLQLYPSARPGIERLCELIGDTKPRHYSIASAQSAVGDRVDLLVVTVEWLNAKGSQRYGQCTRYLAGLKVGQKVTVSIKPSVMKLPADPTRPLIMAGLGTGAAPFRAFLQHLAFLAAKGHEIGPVYYYFGSRYQAAEYLYGEEIEAFILDGIINRAGLAFSRDGPKKVYIQHKMLEDSEMLAKMLHDDKGVFYLCGPTWPVPDVYEALVNALVKFKGADPGVAAEYLENLKEEERYVLEVY